MREAFDPYHVWLGIRPKDQPPNHYRLLGLELFESDADAIASAADARTSHVRANHKGHAATAQQILKELAAARSCLLHEGQKAAYDRQLREAQARRVEPAITARPAPVATLTAAASAPPPRLPGTAPPALAPPRRAEPPVVSSTVARSGDRRRSQWLLPLAVVGGLLLLFAVVGGGVWYAFFSSPDELVADASGTGASTHSPVNNKTKSDSPLPPFDEPDGGTPDLPEGVSTDPGDGRTEDPPAPTDGSNSTGNGNGQPPMDPVSGSNVGASDTPAGSATDPREAPQPVEPDPPPRRPIPPKADLDAAVTEVREVLAEEMDAAVKPSEKVLLAEKLLALSEESVDEDAKHLAMLLEARRLAIEAIEPRSFLRAVEIISAAYEADPWAMQRQALLEAARAARYNSDFRTLAAAGIDAAEGAARRHQFDIAGQLALFASQAAGQCNDQRVQLEIGERSAAIEQQHALHQQLAAARATLATAPDNPAANLTLGRYLCLTAGDWKEGLPHLARGSDPALRRLAADELALPGPAAPSDPSVKARLADAWWDLSEQLEVPQKHAAMRHAAALYRRVLVALTGLERTKADVRLKQVAELDAEEDGPLASGDTIVLDLDVATQKLAVELGNYSVLDPPKVRVTLSDFATGTAIDPSDGIVVLSNKPGDKLVIKLTQIDGAEIHIQFKESASGQGEVVVRPVYHAERLVRSMTNDSMQDSYRGIQRALAERKRRQTADRNAVAGLPTQIAVLRRQSGGSDFEKLRRTTLVGKLQSQLRSAQRNLPNHQRIIDDMAKNLRDLEQLAALARAIHKRARLKFERVE